MYTIGSLIANVREQHCINVFGEISHSDFSTIHPFLIGSRLAIDCKKQRTLLQKADFNSCQHSQIKSMMVRARLLLYAVC